MFSLGTVQLGMNYGIVGKTEQPTEEYAHKILDTACLHGVNMLDTANNYGDSDRVIGTWLKTSPANPPMIVTKIGPFDHSSKEALQADVRRQAEEAVKTLGLDSVDVMMLHYYTDLQKDPKTIMDELARMKAEGLFRLSAISLYSEDDYRKVAEVGFDAVQIPLNIFDQRRIHDGSVGALADAGMIIFTRSVFFQGIVFMDPDKLPSHMSFLKDPLLKLKLLSKEFSMSPDVLCASFVLSIPGVTSLVLGCQTPEQIAQNAALIDKVRILTSDEMQRIYDLIGVLDESIVDPRRWPKA